MSNALNVASLSFPLLESHFFGESRPPKEGGVEGAVQPG